MKFMESNLSVLSIIKGDEASDYFAESIDTPLTKATVENRRIRHEIK